MRTPAAVPPGVAVAVGSPRLRLVVFLSVAFGVSWSLWFVHPLLAADPSAALTVDQLATFGPAVGALIATTNKSPSHPRPRRMVTTTAVLAALVVTSLLLAPRWAESTPFARALLVVLAVVPASLVWAAGSRSPRLGNLLDSILAPRSPWWTYPVALLLFPIASIAGGGLVVLFGGDLGAAPQVLTESSWSSALVVFALTLLFGGPLGEEIGWRGWLVPALQARLSPLVSSLIVGLTWGLWHLPLHLRGMYDDMGAGVAGMALRIASGCLLAVLFTWLYNRARGGLLVVILLHTSLNNTAGYWLPVNAGLTAVLLGVGLVVVIRDRMYRRPRPASAPRTSWIGAS